GAWKFSDNRSVYGTYTLSTDRTDNRRGILALGQKMAISNQLNVFSEGQFQNDHGQQSITQTYGLDFRPTKTLSVGSSLQLSDLSRDESSDLDRDVVSLWGNYLTDDASLWSKLEYRKDRGLVKRNQWLTSTRVDLYVNPSWTLLAKLNYSMTDNSETDIREAKFAEGGIGFAYRPVSNNRVNLLSKYIYLYDLPSAEQVQYRSDQQSHVVSMDVSYRVTSRVSVASKGALKRGSVRIVRDQGDWFTANTSLAIGQVKYHLIGSIDAIGEVRTLWSNSDGDRKSGMLVGFYKHLKDNFKVGVGYNFTNFSDDLTDVDGSSHGWFVNAIGKF
ncbi:MAG: hypothetical protein HKN43_14150, partial [Rhodothermales bacterium]|nr:hypothetical protein [Rhodothermales bacterium]